MSRVGLVGPTRLPAGSDLFFEKGVNGSAGIEGAATVGRHWQQRPLERSGRPHSASPLSPSPSPSKVISEATADKVTETFTAFDEVTDSDNIAETSIGLLLDNLNLEYSSSSRGIRFRQIKEIPPSSSYGAVHAQTQTQAHSSKPPHHTAPSTASTAERAVLSPAPARTSSLTPRGHQRSVTQTAAYLQVNGGTLLPIAPSPPRPTALPPYRPTVLPSYRPSHSLYSPDTLFFFFFFFIFSLSLLS